MDTIVNINQSFKGSRLNGCPKLYIKENIMRQITQKTTEAFRDCKALRVNNTTVKVFPSGDAGTVQLKLHGNTIAEYTPNGKFGYRSLWFTLASWNTVTTKERLNGLFETMNLTARIRQRKFQLYLDTPTESVAINPTGWFAIGGKSSIVKKFQ
jgi:hypothetical protein